jgi:1-acyl-sn-glycerol-3-phosphate acyltransferase
MRAERDQRTTTGRSLPELAGKAVREWIQPLIDQLGDAVAEETNADPFQRDPESVASAWPLLKATQLYFSSELRGWENVPKGEPVIFVGNHSGGMMTLDPIPLILRWIESRGSEDPLYGLAYDLLFTYRGIGPLLRRVGCLPASHENAERALSKGASLIVFPGGDYEVFRPWSERNQIQFAGRMGFVELALAAGVRVIPMTIHGAHDSTLVLTRGEGIARTMGLDRLRIKVFPFIWNIPFGPTPGFIPSLPLPAKVTVELGAPLDWSHHGPAALDDPEIIQSCYDEITTTMQRTMDRLAKEHPNPLLSRAAEFSPVRAVRSLTGL